MRRKRSRLFLALLAVAAVTTAAFLLSTVFMFGAATHRSPSLGWIASTSGYGLVQVGAYHGQFHVVIDFGTPRPDDPGAALPPRGWYAGTKYAPGVSADLRKTERRISRLGADAFLINSRSYFSAGVFGLYPAVLAWLLVWVFRPRKRVPAGYCPACGYDMRASPTRCPECGRAAADTSAA